MRLRWGDYKRLGASSSWWINRLSWCWRCSNVLVSIGWRAFSLSRRRWWWLWVGGEWVTLLVVVSSEGNMIWRVCSECRIPACHQNRPRDLSPCLSRSCSASLPPPPRITYRRTLIVSIAGEGYNPQRFPNCTLALTVRHYRIGSKRGCAVRKQFETRKNSRLAAPARPSSEKKK